MKKKKVLKINITLPNKLFYFLIAIVILVIVGVGVYALAPGIDLSKGYHASEEIGISVGGIEKTLQEAIDGGDLGMSAYEIKQLSTEEKVDTIQVICPFGKRLFGGGCSTSLSSESIQKSYPSGNIWKCQFTSMSLSTKTAYAICA